MKAQNNKKMEKTQRTLDRALKLLIITLPIIIMLIPAAITEATVDQVSPPDGFSSNSQVVTFEYYTGFNATSCSLILDSNAINTQNNVPEGFNTIIGTVPTGTHNWKVSCTNSTETQESAQRTLTIDTALPTVILLNPNNDALLTSSAINLSFVTIDDQSAELNCSIFIDSQAEYTTTAQSAQPMTINLNSIAEGNHTWQVECSDKAQNLKQSEERTFRINTTQAAPIFGLAITARSFTAGDSGTITVAAPAGATARVEICQDATGFVECTTPINNQGTGSYPATANLPYLRKEGKYIVEAYFASGNFSETKIERYNVTSNIAISIDAPNEARKNEPMTLTAGASGGLGELNYTWTLSNGSKYNMKKINVTYAQAGNYTSTIAVKDEYNNTRNKNITITVIDSYTIQIIAKDNETKSPIYKATVKLDGKVGDTDTTGSATIYVRSGKRELTILAENYSIHQSELNLTGSTTYTILMERINKPATKPTVTLINPSAGHVLSGTRTEVSFSVNHNLESNCSVYLAEDTDTGFYAYLTSTKVSAKDSTQKAFEIFDLENRTYYWKVECIDTQKNSGLSEARMLIVGTPAIQPTTSRFASEIESISQKVDRLESASSEFSNMPKSIKDIATAIGLDRDIEGRIKLLKNAMRDIEGLNYKNINYEQSQGELAKIMSQADQAFAEAPVQLELIASDSFVDYIEKSELEDLAREYFKLEYGENFSINFKRAMNWLNDMQQEVVISSKTGTVKITYTQGQTKEITAVIRDVKTFNITRGARMIEAIPKEVVSSSKDILGNRDFITVKEDPIIGFPILQDTVVAYYFEGSPSPESLREIKTAIFGDATNIDPEYVTGFTIRELGIGTGGKLIIPILTIIVLAGLVIGGVRYEGVKAAKYAAYLIRKNDTLHYINVIMNDINDNMQTGNVERAVELYAEAKAAYAELPQVAKNDIYDTISSVAIKLQEYQESVHTNKKLSMLNELIITAERGLSEGNLSEAIQSYKQIEGLYHELDSDNQALIHPHMIDLGTKIQILIASNTRQPLE